MSAITYATGRRKNAIAKVWLKTGSGRIFVNNLEVDKYFDRETHVIHAVEPLEVIAGRSKYDVKASCIGGGKTGQAGAVRMGIARCLSKLDETMHTTLSQGGFLTRDSRMVERKKYGRAKARRRFQFSKR